MLLISVSFLVFLRLSHHLFLFPPVVSLVFVVGLRPWQLRQSVFHSTFIIENSSSWVANAPVLTQQFLQFFGEL